jgi:glycosyltransferase involved in cell wall biosynthesis
MTFLGARHNAPEVLSQMDVVVSSSHYESFGRSLVEAMACGLPVFATAVGGVPEVVDHGGTGFLVPPRDPHVLAEAVARVLQDGDLRRDMGNKGRRGPSGCSAARHMPGKSSGFTRAWASR